MMTNTINRCQQSDCDWLFRLMLLFVAIIVVVIDDSVVALLSVRRELCRLSWDVNPASVMIAAAGRGGRFHV